MAAVTSREEKTQQASAMTAQLSISTAATGHASKLVMVPWINAASSCEIARTGPPRKPVSNPNCTLRTIAVAKPATTGFTMDPNSIATAPTRADATNRSAPKSQIAPSEPAPAIHDAPAVVAAQKQAITSSTPSHSPTTYWARETALDS